MHPRPEGISLREHGCDIVGGLMQLEVGLASTATEFGGERLRLYGDLLLSDRQLSA
jgi:hypothetical protein